MDQGLGTTQADEADFRRGGRHGALIGEGWLLVDGMFLPGALDALALTAVILLTTLPTQCPIRQEANAFGDTTRRVRRDGATARLCACLRTRTRGWRTGSGPRRCEYLTWRLGAEAGVA